MTTGDQRKLLDATLAGARERLVAALSAEGSFRGELSSSALSTATAVVALELLRRASPTDATLEPLVERAVGWLVQHANDDGGFGDTTGSPSNESTTILVWVALRLRPGPVADAVATGAERWIERRCGGLTPAAIAPVLAARYGRDRTFSTPILTTCALGGRFGAGPRAWRSFPALPFELAACPRRWFARLGLPMVSYALPALIALGQARHHHCPSRSPLARLLRHLARARTLRVLDEIQPASGGFLEAAPLTSFVAMSLVSIGLAEHPVVTRAAGFLRETVRPDGSWPIDTNLDTWTTTLAVKALAAGGRLDAALDAADRGRVRDWLVRQQYQATHPYTLAAPGGWAWTDLSGGVPDADDTPGALLALHALDDDDPSIAERAEAGVGWLLDLQNRDGGIPTFCRGFGTLPFDRSSPDLTAHALRAFAAWQPRLSGRTRARIDRARVAAHRFLATAQREDGRFVPLWIGNQAAPNEENPLYGTAQVVRALAADPAAGAAAAPDLARAVRWIVGAQNVDGGFGAAPGVASSIEETAIALEALTDAVDDRRLDAAERARVQASFDPAVRFLAERTDRGTCFPAAPIGLYFARLWYAERLYPILFVVGALEAQRRRWRSPESVIRATETS